MEQFKEIEALFSIVNPKGYEPKLVEQAKKTLGGMPQMLEQFYLQYGRSDELQHLQDELILPDRHSKLLAWDYLVFFNENQGVCQAGIDKQDLQQPDPPVYTTEDGHTWVKAADRVSEFLIAMYGYQASICLPHNPEEFFWITPEEKQVIETRFPKRPQFIAHWIAHKITLYGGDDCGRIALMEMEGDNSIQMNFAANNQKTYEQMQTLLKGIGEGI